MNRSSIQILKAVAKHGEVPLKEAVTLAPRVTHDHRDQYPFAILIEEQYLGVTIAYTPPTGAETMREFDLAIRLHMETLPRLPDGSAEYHGIRMTGQINPEWKSVFLKAKGALYLAERIEARTGRLFTIMIAVLSACLASWFTSLRK